MKKRALFNFGMFVMLAAFVSSCSLRYSDTGRPLDFLKAKNYKAVQKGNESQNQGEALALEATPEKESENEVKAPKSKNAPGSGSTGLNEAGQILLIILAIILPPLAVGLYDGITNRFWIDLLLTLIFWLPGVIYALLIVLGAI